MANMDHAAPYVLAPSFDYRRNASGDGTNITGALRTSASLIDSALKDPANRSLADLWHALIIVVTDGHDTVDRQAVIDCAATLALERLPLISKRIELACVGIGDCDLDLLTSIATQADSDAIHRFSMAGLLGFLKTASPGGRPSLVLHVDAKDPQYKDAIRLFIDIVSHTSGATPR